MPPMSRADKLRSDYNNPCLKEQELSYKCMEKNGYDRDKCLDYFRNYRNCKEFWNQVKAERRLNGIKPYLPPPEERPTAKAHYAKKFGASKGS